MSKGAVKFYRQGAKGGEACAEPVDDAGRTPSNVEGYANGIPCLPRGAVRFYRQDAKNAKKKERVFVECVETNAKRAPVSAVSALADGLRRGEHLLQILERGHLRNLL